MSPVATFDILHSFPLFYWPTKAKQIVVLSVLALQCCNLLMTSMFDYDKGSCQHEQVSTIRLAVGQCQNQGGLKYQELP